MLQTSQVVYLLRPFHRNLGKRIRKSPKLFFMDVGLATFLLGLHSRPAVVQGPSLGPLLETAVVTEWVKAFRGSGLEPPLLPPCGRGCGPETARDPSHRLGSPRRATPTNLSASGWGFLCEDG